MKAYQQQATLLCEVIFRFFSTLFSRFFRVLNLICHAVNVWLLAMIIVFIFVGCRFRIRLSIVFFPKRLCWKKKTYFVSSISSIRFPFASNYILLYVKWVKKKSSWAPLVHIVSPRNTKFTCLLSFWDFSLFRMDFTLYSHFSCLLCKSHFFFHRTIVECSHFLWLSFSKMNSMICV